jgi:tetratricopeptide (TPR) repeat protein
MARRAADGAATHRWADVRGTAGMVEARLLVRLRRLDEAEALIRKLLAEAGEDRRRAVLLAILGEVARRRGELDRAADLLDRALAKFPTTSPEGPPAWEAEVADALVERGRVAEALGDAQGARSGYREARDRFERIGAGAGAAECLDRVGRLQLRAGELAAAEASLQKALSRYEALGSERQLACRMRLARALVRRDPARVWPVVERTESLLARLDHPARVAAGLALKLVRHALDGAWSAWDATLAEAAEAAPRAGAGAYGAAWLAWIAGELAVARGEVGRGRVALRGAATLFAAIGDRALAAEVGPT